MFSLIRALKLFFLLPLMLCGCGNDDLTYTPETKEKVLIAGTSADYPPFEFIENNKITGFDADLANLLSKKLGYNIQMKDMKFSNIITSLQTSRIDLGLSSLTPTPEHAQNVDFSMQYYISQLAILYRKDNPVTSVDSFNEKIIAAQLGSTMESFLQAQLKSGKKFKLLSLAKNPFMVEELRVGRIDGVLLEKPQAKAFTKRYPEMSYSVFKGTDEGYAIAFKKGSPIKAEFDNALLELKKSGELKKLEEKWLNPSAR